ncbi:centrosomal protein of 126 kDa isoform X2 [Notolabrus celidotus]|uniref:centrosomal protein of 126 kDa isoform X2 n=1 Tax=Notolabrus celidotus TaxID=1203425 RepID=UPI0014905777|nr:centrosomal protein of 126 kDa isoform X2 [Notolabrus celidotus]
MQFLQDNFFYHSDSRLGADGGLNNERQLLVEEQKLSRARARKFSVETNQRRKALEERQKQWDKQEQRLRENVLQQRRQRVQDATERFQRAHLPPSQRRRQTFRRNVPNIEDALHQIQGNLTSYTQQSSFLSSNSNICRSCTPSPKPPTVSRNTHHQGLSVVEAITKLLEEQNMTCLKIGQQTEKSEEKQQDPSPQDSRLSDCCYSESLSSRDSLENEDPNHSTKNPQCSYSSILLDSEKSNPDLRKQKDLYPTSDLTPFSAMTLLGDNVPPSRKLSDQKPQKQEHCEPPNDNMHTSKASWGFTPFDSTPKTESQPALNNCNVLTLSEIMSADKEHFGVHFPQNTPNDNIIMTKKIAPDDTALKSLCPKQEALLDARQQRVHDDRQTKHPSATEILLPAKSCSKDIMFEDHLRPNIFLNYNRADNAPEEGSVMQTHRENHNMSTKTEPSASINNLNKVSNLEPQTSKSINTALLQQACLSNIHDNNKCLKCPEEEVQHVPASVGTPHSVRFIKGILKKQSKYMSGDTTCAYGSGHLIFAKQVALAIRDSVELTRAKSKALEGNTVKKKLRWFDEVSEGKEDRKTDLFKQTSHKSHSLPESKYTSEDHQLSLTAVSGASKLGPSMTPPASNGYHFTKQAWTDVGVQVSLPQKRADEVKVPWSSTKTGGPKVPRRERSARTGAGPVSSRARKGTVIRPQSATEVSQIAKTQGKIMVPRPPPRMQSLEKEEKPPYITKSPYGGADHASVNSKQALRVDTSESFFLPCTHHVIKTDSAVMYTPLQPSYTCPVSEVNTKGTPSSGHQETQGSSRRRGMVYHEKGICLDCTPTDEEISKLWYGVRSALATKEVKNMLRRQALESEKGVRKPCVEPSRPPPVSGYRKFPQPSQPTKQPTEPVRSISSAYNVALQVEGLESMSQLHRSEVHAEGLLEERGVVAAMETAQTQRPGTVQRHSQQQGLTNISLEEQKILLSLDRLNRQLCSVREHVGATIGTQGLVLIGTPSIREVKVTNHHKRRASSATNRPRYQKKS